MIKPFYNLNWDTVVSRRWLSSSSFICSETHWNVLNIYFSNSILKKFMLKQFKDWYDHWILYACTTVMHVHKNSHPCAHEFPTFLKNIVFTYIQLKVDFYHEHHRPCWCDRQHSVISSWDFIRAQNLYSYPVCPMFGRHFMGLMDLFINSSSQVPKEILL